MPWTLQHCSGVARVVREGGGGGGKIIKDKNKKLW